MINAARFSSCQAKLNYKVSTHGNKLSFKNVARVILEIYSEAATEGVF